MIVQLLLLLFNHAAQNAAVVFLNCLCESTPASASAAVSSSPSRCVETLHELMDGPQQRRATTRSRARSQQFEQAGIDLV